MIRRYPHLFIVMSLLLVTGCKGYKKSKDRYFASENRCIELYRKKISLYWNNKPDSAIFYAEKGLNLAKKIKDRSSEAHFQIQIAGINEQYGNLKTAVDYQNHALLLFQVLGDSVSSLNVSSSIGLNKAKLGNLNQGRDLIQNSIRYFERHKDTLNLLGTYVRMGEWEEVKGDTPQAISWYQKAESLQSGNGSSDEFFLLIDKIAQLHSKLKQHQQATLYYQKGIDKSTFKTFTKKNIQFINHAANAMAADGKHEKAVVYHQWALKKATEAGLAEQQVYALIGLAANGDDKKTDLSIGHLKNALSIAHKIGHKQLSAEIYKGLSTVYRQQAKYKEALNMLEMHYKIIDSLKNANITHKINVLQSSYELSKTKLRVEQLELAEQEKIYQRNSLILITVAVLLVLVAFLLYLISIHKLNKKLKASNLLKDKLFSIIGHDLRNHVGGIAGLLAIMENEGLSSQEQVEMIPELRKQADASFDILTQLLQWGQSQIKGIQIEATEFSADQIIAKNTKALDKMLKDKSLSIVENYPKNLKVFGDVNHFDFIIRNLLSNAIKFSYPGKDIEITAIEQKENSEFIFSVKDYGKGISKHQQEQFISTELEVSFGTKGEKGTGIGLTLSKEFVRANRGKMWLESKEETGATFYFSWPARI
ncbi:signal transduction histidine kinase [Pedobacter nutrimenti]|uniref:histidine kinase n=2 Tax=Pedobacter nutrimenti TaxID=1241337 RepID=A0A318UPR4_9SPHI|nr:signal transduction histidine kinase [Pedobacter nutrimenti]